MVSLTITGIHYQSHPAGIGLLMIGIQMVFAGVRGRHAE